MNELMMNRTIKKTLSNSQIFNKLLFQKGNWWTGNFSEN